MSDEDQTDIECMPRYKPQNWAPIDTAVAKFGCKHTELQRWAMRGDLYAHHKRGKNGGWLFCVSNPPSARSIERMRAVDSDLLAKANADRLAIADAKGRLGDRGFDARYPNDYVDWDM